MTRRVLIIGAGIVGAAVADGLARREGFEVTVVDRGPRGGLLGATGHAPGFVTVLSESPVLTELALGSADLYSGLTTQPSGFDRIGGLEVAVTESALGHVERRSRMAASMGIDARILGPGKAATLAPTFVDPETCLGALYFPGDAAARGSVLTGALVARGEQAGARFRYDTACTAFSLRGSRVTGVRTSAGERIDADDVVIAAGIWASQIASLAGLDAPLTPIAHPYVYGPTRRKAPSAPQPFVKWRTETVYARDHGDRFGIGTHTNDGPAVDVATLHEAELPWPANDFDSGIESALRLLPPDQRFGVAERLNGMFSMTADGMPLLGPSTSVDGLWIAGSLWLTHAGGAARVLVDLMSGHAPRIDGLDAMVPERFVGHERDGLTARALNNYRRIWMPAD